MQNTSAYDKRLHTFSQREIIPLQPDSFWLLQQGIVKTCTWNEEGTAITLGYWGAGDIVGQPLSLVNPYQIECLTAVEAASIPLSQCDCLSDSIYRHIQQTEELLCIVRSERMYHRLFKILVWLATKFGREVERGKLIDLPLTHQELAEAIGTTRVTVTKLINQLEQEGKICRPRRNSIVLQGR
jgi:CRP-like cAMP-binding protein